MSDTTPEGRFVRAGAHDPRPRRPESRRTVIGLRRPKLAARIAAAALPPVLAAALAAPAWAQTDRTLVANTDRPWDFASSTRASQPFRTGSNGPGYGLSSVGVHLFISTGADSSNISVRIYSTRSNRRPRDLLYVLVNPSTFTHNAVNTFTAPAGATLSANTTYAVVASGAGGTGDPGVRIDRTRSDDEDSGAAAGWSIGDSRYYYAGSGSWVEDSESVVMIEIKGTVTPNTAATGEPTIAGPAQVGMTLTASTSDIMDDNGLTGASYAYQWTRVTEGGAETDVGTDSSSYTLTSGEQGHHLKVKVTFTDDGGTEETRTSGPSSLVLPASSSNCGADTAWCGTLTVGQHLENEGGVADVGFGPGFGSLDDATFTHRGVEYTITRLDAPGGRSDYPVRLATAPALPADAVGNLTLYVQKYSGELSLPFSDAEFARGPGAWFFHDALFAPPGGSLSDVPVLRPSSSPGATRLDGATDVGTRVAVRLTRLNSAATGQPSVAGFPRVGGILRAEPGTIADPGGLPATFPDEYDFQWVRTDADGASNPQNLAGATSDSYTPVAADVGRKLKVKVSFTDAEGVAEGPLESEATAAAVREASSPLLETTLTVGRLRSHIMGCADTNNVNDCADLLATNTFVSTDAGGVAKEFEIVDLQLTRVGWSERQQRDLGNTLLIVFGGIRELRDYEVNNLVLVLDGRQFPFRDADAGGYHVRGWWNTNLDWNAGDTVQLKILDAPGAVGKQQALAPLTASFENLPASHDGSNAFTFRLSFSDEVTIEPAAMRDHALRVSDGTVTGASRMDGRKDLWEFTVQPAGNGAVSILVPADRACTETGALCTANGQRLATAIPAQVVPGPAPEQPQAVALTASFEDAPTSHDGSSEFTMRVRFSEALAAGGARGRVERTLSVTGGAVQRVRRVDQRRDLFQIPIQPSGHGAVTVSLPSSASCDIQDALCTPDDRPLSHAISVTVQGPPGLSVADAEVQESAGASLDFAVTLSRAATGAVTVDYATSDGSATAGSDYTATSGTLSFAAGESAKTVSVPVLEDSHNEGDETLTLSLSNASGAWIEDGEATGTIENHDPLPQAFIARFGRAAAEQVVEQVEQRMAAPRQRGFRARLAGREYRPGMERDLALGFVSGFGPPMGGSSPGASAAGGAPPGAHRPGHGSGANGLPGRPSPAGAGAAMRGHEPSRANGGGSPGSLLPGGDLFSNSEFELNREQHGGVVSVWSRSARSHFSGVEGALSLDGDVRTTMFGADYTRGPLVVGLSVGHTSGSGGYRGPGDGQMTTSMTGVYPWLGYRINDRVSVWGVTGLGRGALTLAPSGARELETGLSMGMAGAGTRGELIGSRATGGFALAFKADALWVGAATGQVDGAAGRLAGSEARVTRVRTALEGSRSYTLGGRVSLTPSVELGLRQDGGDAETGAGLDMGSGLVLMDAETGLLLDVRVRTLVAHQTEGFTERGMSLSFSWDPTPSSPLGLSARVVPSWGSSVLGGAEALWHGQMAYGPGPHQLAGAGGRLDAEVGYGLAVGRRFVGTPRFGIVTSGQGRHRQLGYELGLLDQGNLDFALDINAYRQGRRALGARSAAGSDQGVLGQLAVRW